MTPRFDRRPAPVLGALAFVFGLVACAPADEARQHPPAQPPSSGVLAAAGDGPLVVNDAAAANPALAATPLEVPPGFEVAPRTLRLPPGHSIAVLAAGLSRPRFMAFDAAGNLLVTASGSGQVLRYPGGKGTSAPPAALLSGLHEPTSLAFHDGYLYVGESSRITRFRYNPTGPAGAAEPIITGLPTSGHSTKTVAFGPDGKLYLSMGSSCNICDESDERRAAISRYNPDGTGYELFAGGLRNAVGLAFQPGTGVLWATCNERDMQGNEIPPDLVTRVPAGADFGWPDCMPPHAKPQRAGLNCEGVTPPTVAIQAHSAPLGLAFAKGAQVPDGLYVAQHGSWNREPPAAPKLLHIAFGADGKPNAVRDFATGWQDGNGRRWGRPVGLVVAPDGSLIVSDDMNGLLYRITTR